jgi:hypothetical protein
MKLAPIGPTFLQERDAILAAAQASSFAPEAAADVADVWAGFAIRGMGFSAQVTAQGTGASNTRVIEAFDLPNLLQTPTFSVSDAGGNNNGFPEPGETVSLTIPLSNNTGTLATGTTLQVVGGGSANYGSIANGQTVSQTVSYTVPAGTVCGSALTVTFNVNSSLGATSFTRTILIGQALTTFTQNFDGATAPAFPAGWTAVSVASGINFLSTTTNPNSAPNSAFALDPTTVGGGTDLTSPSMPITAPAATISFKNRFDTEAGWDGGALEISINGGAFSDIVTAGGRFVQNGYNSTLGAGTNNPMANRAAWSGNSGGYITTIAQLPAAAAGQNVQFKWRFGADDNTAGTGPASGWNIDDVSVAGSYSCSPVNVPPVRSRADFDGDGKTDLSVFRPSEGNWYINQSTAGFGVVNWGLSSDVLVPGDYDGDGKADFAVWRPSNGAWYMLRSSDLGYSIGTFGTTGDVPTPRDYDGDGKVDFAVFRPSANTWYILNSTNGAVQIVPFGIAGDIAVPGDYTGDGKADIAVYRAGQWWIRPSEGGGFINVGLGFASDKPVQADYDGDNKDDIAVYRPSTGQWWWVNSSNATSGVVTFGNSTDIPVPGDYDGDGKDDQAIYRNGTWWLNRSTSGVTAIGFGVGTDKAIPSSYVP